MLVPSRGPSLNVAVIVGPISATGVASEGISNSGTAHASSRRWAGGCLRLSLLFLGQIYRLSRSARATASPALRTPSLACKRASRTQHLALARGQAEPVEGVRAEAGDRLLEQQSVRIARDQADGEAPAVALADQRRTRRQREPLRDRPRQPSGMVGLAEVLGQPTPGLGAGELDLAIVVEQRHRRAGRRIVGERTNQAPARLRGPQRTLEPRAGDVEHVAVALGEPALGPPEPGDDRLPPTAAHADRDLVLHARGV